MALARLLASPDVFLALEITPPRGQKHDVLVRRAGLLGGAAAAINVIQRPDRQSSLEASRDLRAGGYDPVWHLVARGDDAHDLPAALERAASAGIEDVLCILGDRPGAPAMKVRDLVAAVRSSLPRASVGATVNQYATGESVVRNLLGKLDAGASFVETQPVFAVERLEPVVEESKRRYPGVGFVALAMPLDTPAAAARMEARLGFAIPHAYRARIAEGPDAAWEAFTENLVALKESGLVAGIAIMTPEMDPSLATRDRIRSAIAKAGLAPAAAH